VDIYSEGPCDQRMQVGRYLLGASSLMLPLLVALMYFGNSFHPPVFVLFALPTLYIANLMVYPASVICLWRTSKPTWTRLALFVNGLFFIMQVVLVASVLLLMLLMYLRE
jgi:hypothetical protein